MLIAQLSDPHVVAPGSLLYGKIDTGALFAAAVRRVARLSPVPDLVVVSGDLVNEGTAREYARVRELLAPLPMPWQVMAGNHDDREQLRAAFPDQGFGDGSLCCARRMLGDLTLLFLDTTIPGEEGGEIADEQLAWLDRACDPDRDCLLFLHHPPFATGIAGLDTIACSGSARLADWLHRHAEVRALACGHVHRPIFASFAGRPCITAPSVAHQIVCDLSGAPDALAWCREPPAFLLHRWHDGELVTHVLPVDESAAQRYD
ncbi:phosphodiesterase [Aromatoleum toluvorans]|uniref:Phosphodiesterase n=1 Tax=Aromatoleum toluvorans TaxID=92002 RepID=A0ABX1PVB9_9RHOO|nr:phosphodiesterase [Aromatoleum toluvorans]NMG43383.1 phosphodiesterase [Aromatoleum toluvorans]